MLLQRFEIGDARGEHKGDLSVEERAFGRKGQQRLGDGREAHAPIESTAAEERDLLARLPRDDAIAVILHLVQPVRAARYLGVEGGEFGGDEFRD